VHLRKLEEVAVVLLVAGAAAAVDVGTIGRRRHHRDDQIVAAEADIVRRIAGMDGEFRRAVRNQLEDHVAVEAHPLAAFADIRAMRLHDAPCLVVQHVDADFPENAQRREVDRFQLVVGDQPGRRQRDFQLTERRLLERPRCAGALARAAAATGAVVCQCRFGGMKGGGHDSPRTLRWCGGIMDRPPSRHCGGGDH
jgi:hypothetical protein